MDFAQTIKNILSDKMKVANIAAFSVLGIFAYLLLVQHDIGGFYKLNARNGEVSQNLAILKTIAQYKNYVSQFNSNFAMGKGTSSLVNVVTDMARKESVTLSLVRPMESASIAGYKKIGVIVEGRAPYYNMLRFVADLEASEKLIVIEGFSFVSEPLAAGSITAQGKEPSVSKDIRMAVFKLTASSFNAEK